MQEARADNRAGNRGNHGLEIIIPERDLRRYGKRIEQADIRGRRRRGDQEQAACDGAAIGNRRIFLGRNVAIRIGDMADAERIAEGVERGHGRAGGHGAGKGLKNEQTGGGERHHQQSAVFRKM